MNTLSPLTAAPIGLLGLNPGNQAIVRRLLAQHLPGHAVFAFGSRVSGWPGAAGVKPASDLDLAVDGQPGDLPLAMLRADLDDSDLPWRVDICRLADLPPTLRQRIARHGYSVQAWPTDA